MSKNLKPIFRAPLGPVLFGAVGLFVSILIFQGCSSKSSTPASTPKQTAPVTQIQFERLKGSPSGRSFKVILTRAGIEPSFVTNTTLSKGSLSAWSQTSSSTIEATVTPNAVTPTGKYKITIQTSDGETYVRTPVVLATVNNRWGQPELFGGSVNTIGWEDSPQAYVKKDFNGNETLYLAFVYMPIRFECVNVVPQGDPINNNFCKKVEGPYLAPERPSMNIASFVAADGTIDHSLPNLIAPGVIGAAKLGTTNYVFKIDGDGYDGYLGTPLNNPQVIKIQNDDGYSIPSGLSIFKNGSNYSLIYHNDNFLDDVEGCPGYGANTRQDAYIMNNYNFDATQVVLGQFNRVMPGGQFSNGSTNTGTNPCPELVLNNHVQNGIQKTGKQDNPTVYIPASGQPIAMWDLEGDDVGYLEMAVLAVGGVFPTGPWNAVNGLPILAAPAHNGFYQPEKSQPLMTATEFCTRNDSSIECTPYTGNPTLAASYGATVTQLAGVGFASASAGQITAVGEPALFTYKGQNCMSFVLAEQVDTPEHLDLGIGWVCE